MGDEETTGGATPTTENSGEPATPPAGAPAPGTAAPAAAAQGGAPAPAPKAAPAGDDEMVTLPKRELEKRIGRAKQSALKEVFGEEIDTDAAKTRAAKAKELEAQQEQQRQAQLTNEQRLQEELAREKARADEATTKLKAKQRQDVMNRETQRIAGLANKHIDPSMTELVLPKFKQHLKTLTRQQVNAMDDKQIEKWFRDFASKNPKLARAAAPAPKPTPKVPVTNGVRGNRPGQMPSGQGAAAEKTARPGQPNSMTKAEIRQKHGVSW